MRTDIAEKFADALGMTLHQGCASVKGGMTVTVRCGLEPDVMKLPVRLDVISHFDCGLNKDAGMLLQGPGDLLCFVGWKDETHDVRFLLIDASMLMGTTAKAMMAITAGVDAMTEEVDNAGAMRGHWSQAGRTTMWYSEIEPNMMLPQGDVPF